MKGRAISLVAGILLVLSQSALGGGARSWDVAGSKLAAGEAEGVAVSPEGEAVLALAVQRVLEPPEATLWSLAIAENGTVIAGAGESGKVHAVAPDGTASVLYEAGEGEVFAVALDTEGRVLAAVSPGATVVRLERDGAVTDLLDMGEDYIWDLMAGARGSLLVATGVPGRLYRLDQGATAPVLLHDPQCEHVRCLVRDREGRLILGTSGRATVIRLEEDGEGAFVLLDAGEGEVTALAVDPADGALWVALAHPVGKAAADKTKKPQEQATGTTKGAARPAGEKAVQGGSVVRIEPDGLSRTLWSSKDEAPLSLLARGPGRVLLGTGGQGRLLLLDVTGDTGLTLDTSSRQVQALALRDGVLAVALSNVAALLTVGPDRAASGTLLSRPHDAERAAQWGRIKVEGTRSDAGIVRLHLRGGNTAEPNGGWTRWIPAEGDPLAADGAAVRLPPTRFIQWRLTLSRDRGGGPGVRSVLLRYLPANRPPVIQSLALEPPGLAFRPLPPPRVTSGEQPVLADLVPPDVREKLSGDNSKKRSKQAFEPGVRTAAWRASDPDGDRLIYDLHVAPVVQDDWILLVEDCDRDFHSFDTRPLPDGRYRLRLVARDDPDNDAVRARHSEKVGLPFLVDNHPPRILLGEVRREGRDLVVRFRGVDETGPVVRAEASFPGEPWYPLLPEDGVGDSREEEFLVRLAPGPEVIGPLRLRVFDEAWNVGTSEVVEGRGSTSGQEP